MDTREWTRQIREYMRVHRMAEAGDGILAAVSGGADSVCLLLVLKELESELGIRLAAFHMNHGLRGEEADRDEAYVRELCEKKEVPWTHIQILPMYMTPLWTKLHMKNGVNF